MKDSSSVVETLWQMRGIWHDRVELFRLDGQPLSQDELAGSPGASPFENLVYIDFDGQRMTQTNVTFRGRPISAKTFSGNIVDGVLVFDPLGEGAYTNIGVSGGQDSLIYSAQSLNDSCLRYFEPDFIQLIGSDERLRTTLLYRAGHAVRSLRAEGARLSPDCKSRHPWDPRGTEGPVHEQATESSVWR